MTREINHTDRFWYIAFILWCKIHGKDHLDPELDQKEILMGLKPDEYDELTAHAAYEILSSGCCPVCWEVMRPRPRADVECQHCMSKIELDHVERKATWEEAE